ncbi:PDZ domain-containing protein [Alkalicoccus luteus]|uniref:PDZ domain-containing protein n=1 Tax=Alkalicoccus luteus TaxID=1237094 RepID=A0A969PQG3_9BACI|nr:PDZ domain-containing protein [Alkalicoccus luteus]NJP37109.1 PDZ domain-containing protein [Alkalicoccus luteus]
MGSVLLEALTAVGRLFLHPLTYIFVLGLFFYHIKRVKRERRHFHTKVQDVVSALLSPVPKALIAGVTAAVVFVVTGVELSYALLLLFSAVWLLQLPFRHASWYSFTVTAAVSMLLLPFLPAGGTGSAWLNDMLASLQEVNMFHLGVLLVTLMLLEAVLFRTSAASSPLLQKSPRGKMVGAHTISNLWLMPAVVLVPAGGAASQGWWPLLDGTTGTFGFMLIPFLVGYQVKAQSVYPDVASERVGARLFVTALLAGAFFAGSFFLPVLIYAAAAVVLLGRASAGWAFEAADHSSVSIYTARENGLTVLGVLPGSTAEKLNILPGETIVKTNGVQVETQAAFYEALQQSSAYAKLEVVDRDGEKRIAQASIYENDHYLIGCLFIPDDENTNLSLRGLRSLVVLRQDRRETADDEEKQEDTHEEKSS